MDLINQRITETEIFLCLFGRKQLSLGEQNFSLLKTVDIFTVFSTHEIILLCYYLIHKFLLFFSLPFDSCILRCEGKARVQFL